MLKQNPKLAAGSFKQKQKDQQLERQFDKHSTFQAQQLAASLGSSPFASKNSQTLTLKPEKLQKKLIKDMQSDTIQMLNGQFKATIKLNKFEDDDRDREKPMYTYQ